ncbi:nuclear transport factor 2 family protein [Streptomyces sp. NPDC035033]|uniref:nuclear transport factor 2 family protein n=1 Tax=Streptomyces sp. NPDC035033 TaxID=3155368 RepID=UPI0033CF8C4E
MTTTTGTTTDTATDATMDTAAARIAAATAAVVRLFDGCLRSLDDRGAFDGTWAAAFFTEDATASTPAGDVRGREAVAANVRGAMGLFDRTVHVGSDYLVDVDGDRATLRGDQLSVHVLAGDGGLFVSGGRAENEFVRTAGGRRLSRADPRVAWTRGNPPVLP